MLGFRGFSSRSRTRESVLIHHLLLETLLELLDFHRNSFAIPLQSTFRTPPGVSSETPRAFFIRFFRFLGLHSSETPFRVVGVSPPRIFFELSQQVFMDFSRNSFRGFSRNVFQDSYKSLSCDSSGICI